MSRKFVRNCPLQKAPWIEESGELQGIVSARMLHGRVEYCVKWKGSNGRENYAWVPLVSLDCPQLVREYEMEQERNRRNKEIKEQRKTDFKEIYYARDNKPKKRRRLGETSKNPTKVCTKTCDCGSESGGVTSFETPPQLSMWERAMSGPNGFARGLKPAKILSITKRGDGHRKFIMKWMGTDRIGIVSAREANEKCPQLVLDFYERVIHWQDM